MRLARGAVPWVAVPFAAGVVALAVGVRTADFSWSAGGVVGIIVGLFMLYFHRNPDRKPPADPDAVVAAADGTVRRVEEVEDERFPGGRALCVSIFLSPLDVHVNRAPITGTVSEYRYVPGRHFFTIQEKSSEYNEHTEIVLAGEGVRCIVHQIAGPFVRRVVCWLREGERVAKGQELGMMRFGSRLDMYLPARAVRGCVGVGCKVIAGTTVVARMVSDEQERQESS